MLSHEEAIAQDWTNRYVLGELPEPERGLYEEHFFECASCADRIRTAYLLVRGVETTLKQDSFQAARPLASAERKSPRVHFDWWRPAVALPFAAMLVLSAGTAFEYAALQKATAPQTVVAYAIPPQTKGEYYPIQLPSSGEFVQLEFDLLDPVSPQYSWTLRAAGSSKPLMSDVARPPASATSLKLLLPIRRLQAGRHELVLRGETGRELIYPFEIR